MKIYCKANYQVYTSSLTGETGLLLLNQMRICAKCMRRHRAKLEPHVDLILNFCEYSSPGHSNSNISCRHAMSLWMINLFIL